MSFCDCPQLECANIFVAGPTAVCVVGIRVGSMLFRKKSWTRDTRIQQAEAILERSRLDVLAYVGRDGLLAHTTLVHGSLCCEIPLPDAKRAGSHEWNPGGITPHALRRGML